MKWVAMCFSRWDPVEARDYPFPIGGPGVGVLFVYGFQEEWVEMLTHLAKRGIDDL